MLADRKAQLLTRGAALALGAVAVGSMFTPASPEASPVAHAASSEIGSSAQVGFSPNRVDAVQVLQRCDIHRARAQSPEGRDGKVAGRLAIVGHRWWAHTAEQIAQPATYSIRVSKVTEDPSTGSVNTVSLNSGETQKRGQWSDGGEWKKFEGEATGKTTYPCSDGGSVELESMDVNTEIEINGEFVKTEPKTFPVPDLQDGGDVDFKGFPTPTPAVTITPTVTPTATATSAPAPAQAPVQGPNNK